MAHTTDGDSVAIAVPFTKATEAEDGTIYVEGLATDDALDLDDQIIDREFATKGLSAWFQEWGNVRQMHSANLAPAGKAVDMAPRPDGVWVKAHIVEPTAVKLVKEQVYKAFSVGISRPRIIHDVVAKGGRVVDGVFSEISLVDFPANPRAKFQLAKRASTGEVEIVEKAVEVELTKAVPTPADVFGNKGADGIEVLRRAAEAAAVEKRDIPDSHRHEMADSDFAGPHESFPIEKPGDVAAAAHLVGKADDPAAVKANIIRIARRKGPEFVAQLPDSWKTVEPDLTKHCGVPGCTQTGEHDHAPNESLAGDDGGTADKAAVPYYVKRLHDATCAAFQEVDVLDAHPAVAKGIPTLVDPMHWGAEVTKAVAAQDIESVVRLSEAFGVAVQLQKSDPKVCEQAMDDLRKMFTDYHPDAHPTPTMMVDAGKFQRPYLSAGRIPATPSGKPRIPLSSHTADPSDFQRGYLTDGRAADSPSSGKSEEADLTKRTYYSNAAKDQAMTVLTQMHDYIVSQHPYVCPMDHDDVLDAAVPTQKLDNRPDSSPTPVTPPAPMNVEKGSDLHKSVVGIVEETFETSARAFIEKARQAFDDELKTLRESNEKLEKRLADLENAPDPAQQAYRGSALGAFRPQAQETTAGRGEEATEEAAQKLAALIKNARHPNSDVSRPAMDRLSKLVGPKQAAELTIG